MEGLPVANYTDLGKPFAGTILPMEHYVALFKVSISVEANDLRVLERKR